MIFKKKKSSNLGIDLLTYLQKFYLNGKGVSLNDFFRPLLLPFTDINPCISELDKHKYIIVNLNYVNWGGINNNMAQNLDTLPITASLTKEGNEYLNEYFERISHQKNIKRSETLDIIKTFIAIIAVASTLFFGIMNSIISGQVTQLKTDIQKLENASKAAEHK